MTAPPAMPYFSSYSSPLGIKAAAVLTRDEWEKQEWDSVQKECDRGTELNKLMLYFLLNRQGYRMEGIERRIDVLLAETWKEKK